MEYQPEATFRYSKKTHLLLLQLNYSKSNRILKIYFQSDFPHQIVKFEESYPDGSSNKFEYYYWNTYQSMLSPYWKKNGTIDWAITQRRGL
jgi:hypothetical protein